MARVTIDDEESYMHTNQGTFGLKEAQICVIDGMAHFDGVGTADKPILSSVCLPKDAAIDLCKQFLEEQGYHVQKHTSKQEHYYTLERMEKGFGHAIDWEVLLDCTCPDEDREWARDNTYPMIGVIE